MPGVKKKTVDVGKEVQDFCTKCKIETVHVVTKITDEKIRKVICNECQSTHVYRGGKAPTPKAKTTRPRNPRKWSTLVELVEDEKVVDYKITGIFSEGDAIQHKKFGLGVITKVVDSTKIEVVFEEEKKLLAQNWETA